MNLLVPLYNMDFNNRFEEIRKVIMCNVLNPLFKKVYIFFEDYDINNKQYDFLKNNKICIINGKYRQMYSQMIKFSNNSLKGEYVVISNTDILFDKTINRISEINFNDKKLIALTRWNKIEDNSKTFKLELQDIKTVAWSYDSYIFQSPIDVNLETLDIEVGIAGCDILLVKRLEIDNKFTVENPCIDIRTYHIDTDSRNRYISFDYYNQYDYKEVISKGATTIDGNFQIYSNILRLYFDYESVLNNIPD